MRMGSCSYWGDRTSASLGSFIVNANRQKSTSSCFADFTHQGQHWTRCIRPYSLALLNFKLLLSGCSMQVYNGATLTGFSTQFSTTNYRFFTGHTSRNVSQRPFWWNDSLLWWTGSLKDKHFPPAKLILICICGGRCAISLRQLASRHRKALIIFQLKSLVSKSACGDVNVNGERTKRADHIYQSAGSNRHEEGKCWSCPAYSEYDPHLYFLCCASKKPFFLSPSLSLSNEIQPRSGSMGTLECPRRGWVFPAAYMPYV